MISKLKMKHCYSRGLVRCCPPLITIGDRRALLVMVSMLAGNELDNDDYISCIENSCERWMPVFHMVEYLGAIQETRVRVPAWSGIFHMDYFINLS